MLDAFFCYLQLHGYPTHHPFQVGNPFLLAAFARHRAGPSGPSKLLR